MCQLLSVLFCFREKSVTLECQGRIRSSVEWTVPKVIGASNSSFPQTSHSVGAPLTLATRLLSMEFPHWVHFHVFIGLTRLSRCALERCVHHTVGTLPSAPSVPPR